MLRFGIPDYRLPPAILDAEIERILALGMELLLNTAVGADIPVEKIYDRHQAVFVGIGAQLGRPLGIPGEEGPGVWSGTDFLRQVNGGESVDTGRQVIVVGGGNTAVDACRTARRGGAEVVLLYRRTRDEMPAYDEEIEAMLAEGVRLEFLAAPLEIQRNGAGVVGLLVQRMALGEVDASGRRQAQPVDGDRFQVEADSVIVAVSQDPDWRQLEAIHPHGGWIDAGEDGSLAGNVWVGGDIQGPGFASLAVTHGRVAAEGIHARLCGLEPPTPRDPSWHDLPDVKSDLYPNRQPPESATLAPEEALAEPGAEVVATMEENEFLREVDSCFSCGQCFGCEHCWMYCSSSGFARLVEAQPGAYFTLALDACESCGKCVDVCPCGYLEFEAPSTVLREHSEAHEEEESGAPEPLLRVRTTLLRAQATSIS
jgi:thioredoxin reductase/Pyruvate/2-oxoacid:ferredoxin oxidoreductase delta subunit